MKKILLIFLYLLAANQAQAASSMQIQKISAYLYTDLAKDLFYTRTFSDPKRRTGKVRAIVTAYGKTFELVHTGDASAISADGKIKKVQLFIAVHYANQGQQSLVYKMNDYDADGDIDFGVQTTPQSDKGTMLYKATQWPVDSEERRILYEDWQKIFDRTIDELLWLFESKGEKLKYVTEDTETN